MKKEVLKLFKSYLGEKSEEINKKALKYGLLIPNTADDEVVEEAIKQYGKDGEKWNQTFHKDFEIVKNAPIEDLIAQQIIHYITTYGFESLGMFDNDSVYIPKEKLEIPELDVDNIEFITIKPITEEELTNKLMILLTSGIALSKETISSIMILSDYIDKNRFDEIINREIKTALYDKYNIMPRNPEEFLRYLIFKITGNTLKIQDNLTIEAIKAGNKEKVFKMLKSYLDNTPNGYAKLSSIFLRNKKLFLALKDSNYKNINKIINKLRKLSIKNHKPLSKNVLDCLTDENQDINLSVLKEELDNATIFRETRILNGILYRLKGSENIVYKIRNGKSYVKKLNTPKDKYIERLEYLYKVIYNHLKIRLSKKIKNKIIYIPDNVTYAAPTSEKQFNNNFPEGSYIDIPRSEDMVYGIHWTNLDKNTLPSYESNRRGFYGEQISENEERVDLDLKQMNKTECFGWDASYRGSSIEFSGDMTNAPLPDGATELYHIGNEYKNGAFLITLNNYTMNNVDVPFEFVVAKSDNCEIRKNHVLNPNDILTQINMTVKKNESQMVVGFITIGENIRFYFNDFTSGANVRTSRQDDITMGTFDYLQSYSKIQLKLNDLLKDAGAKVINEPTYSKLVVKTNEEGEIIETENIECPADLDLSPNSITKETLIELLS